MGIMSQPKYDKIEFKILYAGVLGLYPSSVHLGPWTFEWIVTRVNIELTIFLTFFSSLKKYMSISSLLTTSWLHVYLCLTLFDVEKHPKINFIAIFCFLLLASLMKGAK